VVTVVDDGLVEKVVEVFSRRTRNPEVIEKIRAIGKQISDNENFYHYVMGLAWNYRVPLTPRDVGDIRRILGLL
jgi:ligand-binding sensor protein